jgi:ArsR family transcriptional regulator, arsenate/arsenite/antimonite-responsive transcriptional repressor
LRSIRAALGSQYERSAGQTTVDNGSAMNMDEDSKMLALSAIAHRSRLSIFRVLAAAGPRGLPAGEISARLGIVPSSLSFHLKDMLLAKLVSGRREGTFIYYSAGFDAIHGVIDFLTENCLLGFARIPPPN